MHGTTTRLRHLAVTMLLLATATIASACGGDGPTQLVGGDPPGVDAYDHTLAPGASARDLLSDDAYDSLVVEVHYVDGFLPSDEGLQLLADFLGARLNKPAGIEIRVQPALMITSEATYTADEVRSLEQEHRTVFTEGRTLAVHVLFLGGEYADQANVLGFAYNNTSIAIFEEKIQSYSGGLTEPPTATVEGTVLDHEFGHILGLVNTGSAMQVAHQDEPHGKHCDDPDCLMYYAVRTSDFISNLLGGVPTLDQNCLDDLRANGGR